MVALIVTAIAAPALTTYVPDAVDLNAIRQSPSTVHWLGTDDLGRDVATRLLFAARISLAIGFLSAIASGVIGVLFGGLAGYAGSWLDALLMRITEMFQTVPL